MDTTTLIVIFSVILIVAAGIVVLVLLRKRKTERLRTRFGPEYARAVAESGGRRQGEAGLQEREKRVKGFAIRPLAPKDREVYIESWRKVQAQFVDDPKGSVTQADQLLGTVMSARGYSSPSGPVALPEPSTLPILGAGLVGVLGLAIRRRRVVRSTPGGKVHQ